MSFHEPEEEAIALHSRQAGTFAARYEALVADPYTSPFTYGRYKVGALIDSVLASAPEGSRALDAGCGTGFDLARLQARGFEGVGVEPAEEMRRWAKGLNPELLLVGGRIESLPFADDSFDLLVAIEVIRYLQDPAPALSELARVLRAGGVAIITAAPTYSLTGYAIVNRVTSRVQVPSFAHVKQSFLTVGRAKKLMEEAGFRGLEVHGVFFGPWQALARISPGRTTKLLRRYEKFDDRLRGRHRWVNFANHLVLIGRR